MNGLLVHILTTIPEEKLDTPCVIGNAPPVSLLQLVAAYVAHCEDMMKQILTWRPRSPSDNRCPP